MSGANPLDLKIRVGAAPHARHPFPAILGIDLAVWLKPWASITAFSISNEVFGMIGYIQNHASRAAENVDTDGDSLRRLQELGVSVDDVIAWAKADQPVYGQPGVTHEDLRTDLKRPTPRTNLTKAAGRFRLGTAELVQYRLPEFIGLQSKNPPPTDDMPIPQHFGALVTRAGLTGVAQLGINATSAAASNKSPLLAFVGPTLGQVNDAFMQPVYKTRPGRFRLLPLYPGYGIHSALVCTAYEFGEWIVMNE